MNILTLEELIKYLENYIDTLGYDDCSTLKGFLDYLKELKK